MDTATVYIRACGCLDGASIPRCWFPIGAFNQVKVPHTIEYWIVDDLLDISMALGLAWNSTLYICWPPSNQMKSKTHGATTCDSRFEKGTKFLFN
jgi:hypothetical protein